MVKLTTLINIKLDSQFAACKQNALDDLAMLEHLEGMIPACKECVVDIMKHIWITVTTDDVTWILVENDTPRDWTHLRCELHITDNLKFTSSFKIDLNKNPEYCATKASAAYLNVQDEGKTTKSIHISGGWHTEGDYRGVETKALRKEILERV